MPLDGGSAKRSHSLRTSVSVAVLRLRGLLLLLGFTMASSQLAVGKANARLFHAAHDTSLCLAWGASYVEMAACDSSSTKQQWYLGDSSSETNIISNYDDTCLSWTSQWSNSIELASCNQGKKAS